MFSLLRLIVLPHQKLFIGMLALLIWIMTWFSFLSQSLRSITSYLDTQTIQNLGGDLVIESAKPLSAQKKQEIEQLFGSEFQHSATVRFLNSLTIGTGQPLLTTILGYDDSYPLYGTLETSKNRANGVYISTSLADLITGVTITLGEASLPVAGEIVQMPTAGINIFDGGRFVLVPLSSLASTQLIQTGSRVTYRDAYRFSQPPTTKLVDMVQSLIPEKEIKSIVTEREQREQFFAQLKSIVILALCALVLLTYSGLRIMHDLLIRRLLETIRLVRLLGTTKSRLVTTVLLLLGGLLVSAFVLGGTLGYQARSLLPWQQFSFSPSRSRTPYLRACLVTTGIMGSLLFSWQEFFQDRNLLATSLYQPKNNKQQLWSGGVIAIVLLFALLTEIGRKISSLILGISIVGTIVFLYWVVSSLLAFMAQRTKHWKTTHRVRRWVIRRSSQPGSPMPLMITLMSCLLTMLGICFLFWYSVSSYIDSFQQTEQANTFILNIREEDKVVLGDLFPTTQLYDVILGRISTIDGRSLTEIIGTQGLSAGRYTREFNMTTVPQNDPIAAGRDALIPLQAGEISVDSRVAEDLGIGVGSEIVMSIVGREFSFVVVQLRRTTRNAIRPFFFFQLPADQFASAPRSYFSLHNFPIDQRAKLLREISEMVGNHLSFIQVDELLLQIEQLLGAISGAIVLVLSSVFLCGSVLLFLCFKNLTNAHIHDSTLLQVLGVDELFIKKSGFSTTQFPLLVASSCSLLFLIITAGALRVFQDALPFSWTSIALTCLLLISISGLVYAILYGIFHQQKNL